MTDLDARLPRLSQHLVIVRAGRNSLHASWLRGNAAPDFDMLVAAYDDAAPKVEHPNVITIHQPGRKIAGLNKLFRACPSIFSDYTFIALIDDDIETDAATINELFEIGAAYQLDLWQPSLTWDSHLSYVGLLQNDRFKLRYTNFVEMMCPFFRASYLKEAAFLFDRGWETGIDLIWSRVSERPLYRSAIVDAVAVKHTRPVGTTKQQQGFAADERYDDQMAQVLDHFETDFHGLVIYAALDRRARFVQGRLRLALATARIFRALPLSPLNTKAFLKLALAAVRHTASRPINLDPVEERRLPQVDRQSRGLA
ncbi:hypothetical protein SAMN07250955_11287 [Arboricoccus pini]|uniref:Glycosyl transferase family 2 n=1 Tax=Arboricoccus pini TaxID=1963835 RepID=A0A212RR85_9PROT|nr:hypothetical protein [Arboricoccus pini]SNB75081.1 hypothetical protein SAMN07250955_11287 [Arboricoccus pini]